MSLGTKFQPWVQWGNATEPVSEYQQMYDTYDKFSNKEAKKVLKNPLWKNMSIIQNAMAKTATTFTPATRAKSVAACKSFNYSNQ